MFERIDFVSILKFWGIVAVTNSHLKPVLPYSLHSLSVGGAWGCAIFFFCSGFAMANMNTNSFWKYILRRIVRLYPAIWLFYIATGQFLNLHEWTFFLWPHYWFIRAILLYYVLFFFVVKYLKDWMLCLSTIALVAMVFVYAYADHSSWMIDLTYQSLHITWYYYFAIMLLGGYLRNTEIAHPYLQEVLSETKIRYIIIPFGFLSCYLIKYIAMRFNELHNLQLLFPFFLLLTIYLICVSLRNYKAKETPIWKVTKWVSATTLELYIVQSWLIQHLYFLDKSYAVIVALCAIIISAWLLRSADTFFVRLIR